MVMQQRGQTIYACTGTALYRKLEAISSGAVDPCSRSWADTGAFSRMETAVHQERSTVSRQRRTGCASARQVRTELRRQAQGPQVPAQPAYGSREPLFGGCTSNSQV